MEKVNQTDGVHVLCKKIGETPLDVIESFKKENSEYVDIPMTYAGRLDPMAEGLLLVLSGEKTKEKDLYTRLPKTYTFQILWGFETDTLDVLGKIVQVESEKLKVESEEIKKELEKTSGKFVQKYPAFSSKPISGKPLFEWAREGRLSEVDMPSHEVEVYEAKFISRKQISKKDLLAEIVQKVESVKGDFRQEEILTDWRNCMSKVTFDMFTIDTVEMSVSGGFYVRQFVADLAKNLNTSAVTFHIKRTKVGDFTV